MKPGQVKGYLFEIIISKLLEHQGFTRINPAEHDSRRIKTTRKNFVEFKGRGGWHQIDCPLDYNATIPFIYPIRLLGEVKFLSKPVDKEPIRSYIGIIKDIQENYFIKNQKLNVYFPPRKLEIGVFFSASGFSASAEQLAYVHGIKTISYANNSQIGLMTQLINLLVDTTINVNRINETTWIVLKDEFTRLLRNDYDPVNSKIDISDLLIDRNEFSEIMHKIFTALACFKSNFIGMISNGEFVHFIGDGPFPEYLFQKNDVCFCRVHYEKHMKNRDDMFYDFYLELIDNDNANSIKSKTLFHFSPPSSLISALSLGRKNLRNVKRELFDEIVFSYPIANVSRNLTLRIEMPREVEEAEEEEE